VEGVTNMRRRRAIAVGTPDTALLRGPGNFCKALGITLAHNGASLLSGPFSIHAPRKGDRPGGIGVSSRIGISKAVDHPYRFFLLDDPHVSGSKRKNGASRRASRKERRHA
ncbi:MAG TPA: DNA-3-methyladenine glycosylase, partial [Candidatus Krumholzibacteria bacterium]|nr:DNA-3-methyladenine glycosylase [Candidatus Krumholzibacteria bacterium]